MGDITIIKSEKDQNPGRDNVLEMLNRAIAAIETGDIDPNVCFVMLVDGRDIETFQQKTWFAGRMVSVLGHLEVAKHECIAEDVLI